MNYNYFVLIMCFCITLSLGYAQVNTCDELNLDPNATYLGSSNITDFWHNSINYNSIEFRLDSGFLGQNPKIKINGTNQNFICNLPKNPKQYTKTFSAQINNEIYFITTNYNYSIFPNANLGTWDLYKTNSINDLNECTLTMYGKVCDENVNK